MRRLLLPLIAAGLLAVPATAPAAPVFVFSPAVAVSDPFGGGGKPAVAIAPTGAAVAAWSAGSGQARRADVQQVQVAVRSGGDWSAPIVLSEPTRTATAPHVAIDTAGNAMVVWTEYAGAVPRVLLATVPAGGVPSAAQTLSDVNRPVYGAALAENGAGDAVVAFSYADEVDVVSRTGTSAFGDAQPLVTASAGVGAPDVALNAAGAAVVSWSRQDSSTSVRVLASRRPAGSDFGAPVALTPDGTRAYAPRAGVDAAENATVGYEVAVADSSPPNVFSAHAVTWSAAGVVGSDQPLSATSGSGVFPQVFVDGAGESTAVWARFIEACCYVIEGAVAPAGHAFGATETLDDDAAVTSDVALAGEPGGRVVAAWPHGISAGRSMQVARRSHGGPFDSSLLWSGAADFAGTAVASYEQAAVVWLGAAAQQRLRIYASTTAPVPDLTATPGPSASPTPTPTYPLPLTARLSPVKQSLRAVRRARAIKVRCSLDAAGACFVSVSVSRRVAQRLHLRKRTIAHGGLAFSGRRHIIRARLGRGVRARLRRPFRATISGTGIYGSGRGVRVRAKPITIRLR